MKKLYTAFAALMFSLTAISATINVSIIDFSFTPANVSASIGDTVLWTNNGAMDHTASSTSVPGGALAFDSGTLSPGDTFSLVMTTAGTYNYRCNIHTAMTGTITVSPLSVKKFDQNVAAVVYPNPFKNKISLTFKKADQLSIYNVTGKSVKIIDLTNFQQGSEIDLADLHAGVYFYSLISGGAVVETKRLIKSE
jgi:plastocyanin